LNQIRIVTGATIEEADAMGDSYRRMAQQMSVSSTEIANAAVEFWRQGLSESEVNSR
jgi:NifU-like protein involved in Fe-S cluster formation